jgi:hypothetical protein
MTDRCANRRVAASGNVLDPDGDGITATKLAGYRLIVERIAWARAFTCFCKAILLGSVTATESM